ncbi:hypothetical protein BJV82DRAFT_668137 [Fennellomyces sp. T-0311]|nr:hypothetical protein BJV82DRAFT_668137 [Fennellomyces sp. T-0311]
MSRKRHRVQPGPDREQFSWPIWCKSTIRQKIWRLKQQVLANPLRTLHTMRSITIGFGRSMQSTCFLVNAIEQPDPLLKEFGMGGLTNICRDPQHSHYILSKPENIEKIAAIVVSNSQRPCTTDAVINAMVALMFLVNESSRPVIVTPALKEGLLRLQDPQTDKRINTIATLFLTDYFQT